MVLKRRVRELLSRFARQKLLIIGDAMLDHYVSGSVTRISPEAPVPVVEIERVSYLAGGASNVAVSVAALGGTASLLGAVGDDPEGLTLREVLSTRGVDPTGLRTIAGRPTTLKTRVLGRNQQIVRLDRELRCQIPDETASQILAHAIQMLPEIDGVVLSDYGKGVVSPELASEIVQRARAAEVPVLVDPQGRDYGRYLGATVVKPNQKEAGQALNIELSTPDEIVAAGWSLLRLAQSDAVLITQGPDGMTLFEADGDDYHLPSFCAQAFDPTGAGDVVTSVYALALAGGATHREAAYLANHAAALACRKLGATPVTLAELRVAFEEQARDAPPARSGGTGIRPIEVVGTPRPADAPSGY